MHVCGCLNGTKTDYKVRGNDDGKHTSHIKSEKVPQAHRQDRNLTDSSDLQRRALLQQGLKSPASLSPPHVTEQSSVTVTLNLCVHARYYSCGAQPVTQSNGSVTV